MTPSRTRWLTVAMVLTSALGAAQTLDAGPRPKRVDFEDDVVVGTLQDPLFERMVGVAPRRPESFLIRVRENFDDKVRQSVHEM
jgi:hypothetical protein